MALGNEEFDYLDDGKNVFGELPESEKPKIQVKVKEKPVEEPKQEEKVEEFKTDSIIYIVKVTTNKEQKSLELVADKVNKKGINIYAVAKPHGLRGYIILEAPDKENAEEAVFNLPYIKGIIPKQVSYEEIKSMIEPRASEVKIEKNDIVEIISDSFKNEKAKVIRVDKTKGEAVVSLLAAVVPIPVTVKLDNLRVIRREDEAQGGSA
ncbi:Transcription elongation factor Spt5 [uncultured archaeon]|nr:Transcription elongation factor Spt5 [uncultured archaeon]